MTETERKEKMNELMNKISIALKDAILAQGFEIICKRIAELEKENEELNIENGALNTQKNKLIEHNAELFLENEDLKSQIEKMKCCENCRFWQDNDCIVEHDYDCKRWNNTNTDDYWGLVE